MTVVTAREREVMELVVAGEHKLEIADTLQISVRKVGGWRLEVDVRKARMPAINNANNATRFLRLNMGRKYYSAAEKSMNYVWIV